MEGPTPVSALIHAATMVTGGVFLLTRINPVIAASYDWVPTTIAWIGAITAIFAATIALAQNDIKKVLAYSTISQIGFMVLAVGSGAYVAAIFHMITHAAFKALLFLGAGSVIHGMHHEQDMRRMGALRKFMPITAATFIIGWLSISGVPPFSGFWSKDEILLFALADSTALYVIGLITAVLTALYMTRQVIMVFFGEARWTSLANDEEAPEAVEGEEPAETHHAHGEFKPHESPPIMWIPLVVLAGIAALAGIVNLPSLFGIDEDGPGHQLEEWLHPVVEVGEADISGTWAGEHMYLLVVLAVASALVGLTLAYFIYLKKRIAAWEPTLFARGWYYDWAITWFMGNPGREGFQGVADFDAKVVDGAVNGVAVAVKESATGLSKGQTGYVRQYAAVIGIGVVLLLGWFVVIRGICDVGRRNGTHRVPHPDGDHPAARLRRAPGRAHAEVAPGPGEDGGAALLGRDAGLTIWLMATFETGDAGFQFQSMHTWIEQWGISWHVGVDGISLFLVVLTGVLFPLSSSASTRTTTRSRTSPGCSCCRPG